MAAPTVRMASQLCSGTATYMGGAAGKYCAQGSDTGGTNDAGHFTADVRRWKPTFTNNAEAHTRSRA